MAIKQKLLDQLNARREEALSSNCGEDKIAARHAKGLMTARERIYKLVDKGSFQELGCTSITMCAVLVLKGKFSW
jgi:propionyl-CoA carboxylase beta chain